MNTHKIIELARKLQEALPFAQAGIKTKEECEMSLALVDQLTDSYNQNDAILLDILWPAITRYEENAPELLEFNNTLKMMEYDASIRYAKLLIVAVGAFKNEDEAVHWLNNPVGKLSNNRPVDMIRNDADMERVLQVIKLLL